MRVRVADEERVPGFGGVAALERTRASAPRTRVIMMTACIPSETAEEARPAAAAGGLPGAPDVGAALGRLHRATDGGREGEA